MLTVLMMMWMTAGEVTIQDLEKARNYMREMEKVDCDKMGEQGIRMCFSMCEGKVDATKGSKSQIKECLDDCQKMTSPGLEDCKQSVRVAREFKKKSKTEQEKILKEVAAAMKTAEHDGHGGCNH
jgi:ribosome maturation protein Sdo1